jgi:hypothetical protein
MTQSARIVVTALALLLAAGCATLTEPWQAPEVTPLGLRVAELGPLRQVFVVTLAVTNPNDRTLPIKAMTYRLTLEGKELAQGSSRLERQIPALGEESVEVEVAANLLGVVPQLPALALQGRPLDWTIAGTLTIADGLLTLPYRYSGQVDAADLLAKAAEASRARPRQPRPSGDTP